MKIQTIFSLLAPAIVIALPTDTADAPGVVRSYVDSVDPLNKTSEISIVQRQDGSPPYWNFGYTDPDSGCDGLFFYITNDEPLGCTKFEGGPPGSIVWTNPIDPNTDAPYWNLILHYEGDNCPVVGINGQCDGVANICGTFGPEDRPQSFNIIRATSGVRSCDIFG